MRSFVLLLLLSTGSLVAHAQFVFTLDAGQQSTQYGSSYNSSYNGPKHNVGFADLGLGAVLFGHSPRTHGVNFFVGADAAIPFNNDTYNGGVLTVGGVGQVNFRRGPFSIGTGLDLHYYTFPQDNGSAPERPSELIASVPVVAKFTFGPGGRAFVQGGGSFAVASTSTDSVTDSLGDVVVVNTATIGLSKSHTSGDVRVSGGYIFKRAGLRASYVKRDIFFDVTPTPAAESYFDFHQEVLSGGIILNF